MLPCPHQIRLVGQLIRQTAVRPAFHWSHVKTARTHAVSRRQYSLYDTLREAHRALELTDLPRAKALFQKLVSEPNATVDIMYNLGVVEWLSKKPEAAVKCWQAALRTNLANYYLIFEPDLSKALDNLKAASELSPEDGEIKYNYALALEKDDQIELALEYYLRAEELGVTKNIDTLIRNAGAKLLKRNNELPPTEAELEAQFEPAGTQVDYGPSGKGR